MNNNYMNELNFSESLYNALPVLKEINELYTAANSLRQRSDMRAANRKASFSKTAKLKAAAVALVLYAILTFILKTIIYRIAIMTGANSLPPIYSLIGISICVFVYIYLKKYFANMEPASTSEDISAARKIESISEQIYDISTENADILEKIPSDYRCYEAALFMYRALQNGRAENQKEAINLYEEELHRRRLEAGSAASVRLQQEQSRMLADIAYNSDRAAVNSGIAATFSILAYLGRG